MTDLTPLSIAAKKAFRLIEIAKELEQIAAELSEQSVKKGRKDNKHVFSHGQIKPRRDIKW
jgi:antitoxin component of MazEF toxin-antitoxin module